MINSLSAMHIHICPEWRDISINSVVKELKKCFVHFHVFIISFLVPEGFVDEPLWKNKPGNSVGDCNSGRNLFVLA